MTAVRLDQFGSAIPTALAILTVLGLLAMNAMRTAALETQLSGSLTAAHSAFGLADYGIGLALRAARLDPAGLPRPGSSNVHQVAHGSLPSLGNYAATIRFRTRDNHCPALSPAPAERLHYEISSTGRSGPAVSSHIQGFSICHEICSTATCIATELPAVASYWTAINN